MKFSLGAAAAALVGFATALETTDVYILQSPSQEPVTLENGWFMQDMTRLVLLQRLAPEAAVGHLAEYGDRFRTYAVPFINKLGRAPQSLFGDWKTSEPSQLVVMLEGTTPENLEPLKELTKNGQPAFRVRATPSASGNRDLIQQDFASVGVAQTSCSLERALNPLDDDCWVSGKSLVASYDVKKDPSVTKVLADNLQKLSNLVSSGELEVAVLLIPESSRDSPFPSWALHSPHRRRQLSEEVMSEEAVADDSTAEIEPEPTSPSSPLRSNGPFVVSTKDGAIPACFASKDSCQSTTGNCSGHGECRNKYAKRDGSDDDSNACFTCHCLATKSDAGSVTHWAGATCGKVDVSMQFWLFAGFTIAMLGIVSFAISLLFNVGEEKLPGVIGAGVSRSR